MPMVTVLSQHKTTTMTPASPAIRTGGQACMQEASFSSRDSYVGDTADAVPSAH